MKKIGLIGTGIMGSGIVNNFLKAGYEVNVWNRTLEKTDQLQAAGAILLDSPAAVTHNSDIIFEVTANDNSSRQVWQGDDGILSAADSTKFLIASSTISIGWVSELSKLCAAQAFTFLDMPLTGGRIAAEGGNLTLLVGGDKTQLENIEADLKAISAKIFYFGASGSGMKYKLVLNSLQAAHLAAFGEAMRMAVNSGLDPELAGPVLCERPGGVVTNIAWASYQAQDLPLTFSVDWIAKDLKYAREMSNAVEAPILEDVISIYSQAQAQGLGDKDWAIINKEPS